MDGEQIPDGRLCQTCGTTTRIARSTVSWFAVDLKKTFDHRDQLGYVQYEKQDDWAIIRVQVT